MAAFGMYKGERFQDRQRKKMLKLIDRMIRNEELAITFSALCADSFYDGMSPFRDQLDLHNQCLLSNVKYQSDKIFVALGMKIELRRKMKG